MDSSTQRYNVVVLDVESIQPIKVDLARKGLLDSVLKSNLDFAMRAVDAMPISKRKTFLLQVEGEQTLLRISALQNQMFGIPIFYYTVWNDNGCLKLIQKIQVQRTKLTVEDIDASHFIGHCCRDEMKSCINQAHDKVTWEGLDNVELRIKCGELQLTYITLKPSKTIEIRPEWRVKINDNYLNDVLRIMNHMERIGEMSPGLFACFRHLINSKTKVTSQCNWILLMSEGQRVEFFYELWQRECLVIFKSPSNEVCSVQSVV